MKNKSQENCMGLGVNPGSQLPSPSCWEGYEYHFGNVSLQKVKVKVVTHIPHLVKWSLTHG